WRCSPIVSSVAWLTLNRFASEAGVERTQFLTPRLDAVIRMQLLVLIHYVTSADGINRRKRLNEMKLRFEPLRRSFRQSCCKFPPAVDGFGLIAEVCCKQSDSAQERGVIRPPGKQPLIQEQRCSSPLGIAGTLPQCHRRFRHRCVIAQGTSRLQ